MINGKQKQTKIIATLGPSSKDASVLKNMLLKGVDVVRLNASHYKDPKDLIQSAHFVRSVSQELGMYCGIFLDLQGPKIRLGQIKEPVLLEEGQWFTLSADPSLMGDVQQAGLSYPEIIQDISVGDSIYINDGTVRLIVKESTADAVVCQVDRPGQISSYKGVNLPSTDLNISILSEKDKNDLIAIKDFGVDYIALSFISSSDEIINVKKFMKSIDLSVPIISKIERRSAVDNIQSIIQESDILMVARGDLGVEIGVEQVPQVQKMIIRESMRYVKPVIVATQMLESMVYNRTATRAEVSDVANAIYDRCDAVMLSGETAVGVDPAQAVETMAGICQASDQHLAELKQMRHSQAKRIFEIKTAATSFCKAADQIADENNADAILAFTSSGTTPLIASKLNPIIPIIAPTDSITILRRLCFYRGVTPLLLEAKFAKIQSWSRMIEIAVKDLLEKNLLKTGDKLVVTAGIPIGVSGGTNSIRMITIL